MVNEEFPYKVSVAASSQIPISVSMTTIDRWAKSKDLRWAEDFIVMFGLSGRPNYTVKFVKEEDKLAFILAFSDYVV